MSKDKKQSKTQMVVGGLVMEKVVDVMHKAVKVACPKCGELLWCERSHDLTGCKEE